MSPSPLVGSELMGGARRRKTGRKNMRRGGMKASTRKRGGMKASTRKRRR